MTTPARPWQLLSLSNPSTLYRTIQQMHHAVQYIGMLGNSFLPADDDDSRTNLEWLPDIGALAGRLLPFQTPVRLALVYEPFKLRFIDPRHAKLVGLRLEGQHHSEILAWLRDCVATFGGRAGDLRPIRHYSIPLHPIDSGAPFHKTSQEELQELARYRHNAALVLKEIAGKYDHASPVRTWPHHFDTGAVLEIARDEAGRLTHTIGIGLAIPDERVDEPYFYVNHWAAGADIDYSDLPDLPEGGEWQGEGFTGAMLRASALLEAADAAAQHRKVGRFLRAGVNASMLLLGQEQPL